MENVNVILFQTNSKFPYILLGKSYKNPIDSLDIFKQDLILKKYNGKVLVDSLLSNGYASNRFATIIFNGKEFDMSSIKIIDDKNIPIILKNKIYQYFYENPNLIENNYILTRAEKYQLLNGKNKIKGEN